MALPSYYTPTKPYTPPRIPGGTDVQNLLYKNIAAGNVAGATSPSGLTPINNSIDTAEGINLTRGGLGRPYTGAGATATAPAAPPTSDSSSSGGGGGGGGGGGFPGFEDDPILARTKALWASNVAQAEAAALAGRKQAEIGYGYDPNYTYADPATQEAAKQNAFSDLANLLYQHGERSRTTDESLNKSNLFYSGERDRQLGREGRQYTLEQLLANQGFQGKLTGISNALMQTRLAAQQAELAAQENAYNRELQFRLQYGIGGGEGGGGGGSDFYAPINPTGLASGDIASIAAQYSPSYGGQQFVPSQLMHEGEVTYQGGKPGVFVKYSDPTGRQAGDTVWVPIG